MVIYRNKSHTLSALMNDNGSPTFYVRPAPARRKSTSWVKYMILVTSFMNGSVRLSCLSVLPTISPLVTPFSLYSHHRLPMTEVMPIQKVKVKGHRNRGQNAIANLDPNERFRTGRGALLFFKDICQICRSHGTKISSILTRIERFYKSPRQSLPPTMGYLLPVSLKFVDIL